MGYYTPNNGSMYFTSIRYTTEEIFEDVKSVIDQFEKAGWVDISEPHFVLKIKED